MAITLTSLSPASMPAGSPPATVDVSGTGFDSTCTVEADTVGRTTFFLDAGHLQFTARPDVVTTGQTHQITVANTAGDISNALTLTFTGPAGAPAPTVQFWRCYHCGISVPSATVLATAPVCVCNNAMTEVTDKVPVSLAAVVWRDAPPVH